VSNDSISPIPILNSVSSKKSGDREPSSFTFSPQQKSQDKSPKEVTQLVPSFIRNSSSDEKQNLSIIEEEKSQFSSPSVKGFRL
jgi:hypothetical protein